MSCFFLHYSDVIMSAMTSQITGVPIVCSTVCSGADQGRHQRSASLAFVRGIHRWPVGSAHKVPVTRKILPIDDVIMSVTKVCRRYASSFVVIYPLLSLQWAPSHFQAPNQHHKRKPAWLVFTLILIPAWISNDMHGLSGRRGYLSIPTFNGSALGIDD